MEEQRFRKSPKTQGSFLSWGFGLLRKRYHWLLLVMKRHSGYLTSSFSLLFRWSCRQSSCLVPSRCSSSVEVVDGINGGSLADGVVLYAVCRNRQE